MDRRENLAESQGLDHWEQLDWTDPVSVREDIYVKFVKAYWGAASRLRGSLAQTALAGALGSPSVVHRDANGDVIRDPQGYPVLARAEIPPDPRLALNLLARLEPQTWGPAKATDPALWGAEETVDTLEIEYVPERAISDDDRRELENLD